jgi:hypothetical protein
MGGILYALVSRGTVILAEYSSVQGNASVVAVQLLEKLPTGDLESRRSSFVAHQHVFHLLTADGMTYLCMAEEVSWIPLNLTRSSPWSLAPSAAPAPPAADVWPPPALCLPREHQV